MSDNTPLSILIIEDNPGDLFLLEELIEASALPVKKMYKVNNASQAVQVLKSNTINLVLLDLSLPDSNGLQSYTLVNEYASSIPIIVLTGMMDMDIALITMSRGAQDYLIKGEFDEKLLYKSIQYSIERKRNLEILLESNERYAYVTKATSDVVWDWNLQTNQVYWAVENMQRLFGYELPDPVTPINFWENCIHPEDRQRVLQNIHHAIRDHTVTLRNDEYRFKKKDGTYAYVVDKGYVLFKGEAPIRMIASLQDITDRKLAEIQIANSEKRFRSMVQSGSDMIKIMNEKGVVTFLSPTVTKVLGFREEELIGRSAFDFIHPDDLVFAKEQFRLLERQQYVEVPYFRFSNSKGEWRWLETTLINLLDEPLINAIVSNSRDVTEKKKAEEEIKASEERYRNLFSKNPMTIFVWDIETLLFMEVNNTALKEYGYTVDEFLSMNILSIRPAQDVDKVKVVTEKFAIGDYPTTMGIWQHVKKNGEVIFMDVYSHKINFKGRDAVLTIALNVTEKVRLENNLQEERQLKQKEITEAVIKVQEKERYEISKELHDNVNQQLTVAMMYIATAQKDQKSHEELLKQSSGFIFNAIEEIRKLSKALVTPLIKDFGLSKAIDGLTEDIVNTSPLTIDFFADSFYEEDIKYEFKLNIFRIVQEQLNNILKHAQASHVTIELCRDKHISLAIIDNGVGFNLMEKRNGIGLNNIISRAELYNGKVNLVTAPGKGCRLNLYVPVTADILHAT